MFAVRADASEVTAVSDRVHADAVFLSASNRLCRRFVAGALSIAEVALKLQNRAFVLHERGRRIRVELAALEVIGVHRDHADAVAVVTAQIGIEHVVGYEVGFVFVASGLCEKRMRDLVDLFLGMSHRCRS